MKESLVSIILVFRGSYLDWKEELQVECMVLERKLLDIFQKIEKLVSPLPLR